MESRDRSFTLIIAPNHPSKIKQFRISMRQLYSLLTVLLVLGLSFCYGFWQYLNAKSKLSSLETILSQNNRLQEENLDYTEKTRQLTEKVSHIEIMAKNISRLTGIDLDSPLSHTGGVGGSNRDNYNRDETGARNMDMLQSLNQKTDLVENQILHLKDVALEQSLFLSSLPTSWPARGYISSYFGHRPDPLTGVREFHPGIDISAPYGAKVIAPADGIVIFAGAQRNYGYTLVIAHKYGITTRYAHLASYSARPGQRIKRDDVLGFVGSTGRVTGPHLHFEIVMESRSVNPLRFLGNQPNL